MPRCFWANSTSPLISSSSMFPFPFESADLIARELFHPENHPPETLIASRSSSLLIFPSRSESNLRIQHLNSSMVIPCFPSGNTLRLFIAMTQDDNQLSVPLMMICNITIEDWCESGWCSRGGGALKAFSIYRRQLGLAREDEDSRPKDPPNTFFEQLWKFVENT